MRRSPIILFALATVLLVDLATAQGQLSPPRGTIGPATGDAAAGGPGDRAALQGAGSASWIRWWAFNRDAIFGSVRGVGASELAPRALDGAPGGGPPNPSRPADVVVYGEAAPAILRALESERDLDIRAAALMALGKIGSPPRGLPEAEHLANSADVLRAHLGDSHEMIQSHAVLALGVLGDAQQAPLLASIAREERDGQKATGGRSIDSRVRAFATFALADIGLRSFREAERTFVSGVLLELITEESKDAEIATAAVIGLGLNPLPVEPAPKAEDGEDEGDSERLRARQRQVETLLAALDNSRFDRRAKAQVPVALARLVIWPPDSEHGEALEALRVRVVNALVSTLAGAKDFGLREGAIQGLGLATSFAEGGADRIARQALTRFASGKSSSRERELGLAYVALARIAARGPAKAGEFTRDVRSLLGERTRSGSPNLRGWAYLAVGLLGFERRTIGADPALGTEALLAEGLESASNPEERAAAALALGLRGAIAHRAAIEDRLDEGDFHIRGLHATALAVMPAPQSISKLAEIARNPIYRPYLLRDVATAMALLDAPNLVGILVGKLVMARFIPDRLAALVALAWSEDPAAFPALIAYATEKRIARRRVDDTTRAFAIAALGSLAARDTLPWNAKFAADIVWSIAPPTVTNDRDGGGLVDVY